MTDPIQSQGTDVQRRLSDLLYAEMLHSAGAYGEACDRLERLRMQLKADRGAKTRDGKKKLGGAAEGLIKAAQASYDCNDNLRNGLHRPSGAGDSEFPPGRHPSPFPKGVRPRRMVDKRLLRRISSFYLDEQTALACHLANPGAAKATKPPSEHRLGARFAFVHDPQRRDREAEHDKRLIQGKIDRTRMRLRDIDALLGEAPDPHQPSIDPEARRASFKRLLVSDAGDEQSLLLTLIEAMTKAHLWMHQAEHEHAQSFGPLLSDIPGTHAKAQRMLRYSLALNTFVFVAARAVPWIFAEDEVEREYVLENYEDCCVTLAPTYCMWISAQLSLLALHRRAFTWWTMGKHDRAYRDFHKLTRLLRGLRKPASKRGLRVPGTTTFIEGMTGMCELHIGRIYRGQHAHGVALKYFERASIHLKDWEEHNDIGPLIKNSYWRLNLLQNEGKANYELGRIKRSILCYARAWGAFLGLVESETEATANAKVVKRFVEWLAPIAADPELSRAELRVHVEPLIEQMVTLRSPVHLRLLAADIVMRMGHLLYTLKLPAQATAAKAGESSLAERDLALECHRKACELDPTSTLAAADLLRIETADGAGTATNGRVDVPLADHWPSAGGRFEEVARVTEYVLQRWLAATAPDRPQSLKDEEHVARALLGSFLEHTDSSNVKLAQVYRYLMPDYRGAKRKTDSDQYTIDFVCLRRYSSFFPFLPRPAAFRAPGGGYFVQVHEPGAGAQPFGIAVDPGPDFIENLYRCGYSLADIQMIVITHDHADHIASLDALLALMGIRKGLGVDTFDQRAGHRLAIVGNESVCQRYAFYGEKSPPDPDSGERKVRRDAVCVMSFEEIARITALRGKARKNAITAKEIVLDPLTLGIEPVETWGHTDAHGYLAQGFLLSLGPEGERSSILFTGDTGAEPANDSSDLKSLWEAAEEADVVVAHLSSVPLLELRKLAGLKAGADAGADKLIAEFSKFWDRAARKAETTSADEDEKKGAELTRFLLRQLQFGFRSKPAGKKRDLQVSPFSDFRKIREQPKQHLYLTGMLELARRIAGANPERAPLLLIGELREELGTFRTQIAQRIAEAFFRPAKRDLRPSALTTDIGLRVRISRPARQYSPSVSVLCTICDLDNDLMSAERFHPPDEIREVCIKGEDEGVFYNCQLHDPRRQGDDLWLESIERYDVFGD